MAHLLKYDSVTGTLASDVEVVDDGIEVDGYVLMTAHRRPNRICRWGELDVDVVIESTGIFTSREGGGGPLEAGARVIISAPCGECRRDLRDRASTRTTSTRHPQGHLQRFVHDQLLRADGQGARRRLRRREGPHDHRARLHGRPGPRRRPAQGPAPCAGRGRQHHSDLHRCGVRPASCCQRCRASSTAWRCGCRSPTGSITDFVGSLEKPSTSTRSTRRMRRPPGRPAEGVLDVQRGAAVSSDIVGIACLLHLRRRPHHGDGQPRQGPRLVRQRVGLLEPSRRSDQSSATKPPTAKVRPSGQKPVEKAPAKQ